MSLHPYDKRAILEALSAALGRIAPHERLRTITFTVRLSAGGGHTRAIETRVEYEEPLSESLDSGGRHGGVPA